MTIIFLSFVLPLFLTVEIQAPPQEKIIDLIYKAASAQEAMMDSLSDFSYMQQIHFKKLDSDDEVDEQSKRTFLIKVHNPHSRERELISAFDYEDGEWKDVTETEKNKKMRGDTKSQKFSLLEMVGPAVRDSYRFQLVGEERVNDYQTIHLHVDPLQAEEDKFRGDLWISASDYGLVKAVLIPAEFPTGVADMEMIFSMKKLGAVWLPKVIRFEASISFLIIFKGKIKSEIRFYDYKFQHD